MAQQSLDERTPPLATILERLDIILNEVLELRQAVQSLTQDEQPKDIVDQLSGCLGPASQNELEYFNTSDLAWQRFDT